MTQPPPNGPHNQPNPFGQPEQPQGYPQQPGYPTGAQAQQGGYPPPYFGGQPPQRNNKGVLIALSIIGAVLILGGIIFSTFFFSTDEKGNSTTISSSSSITSTPFTTTSNAADVEAVKTLFRGYQELIQRDIRGGDREPVSAYEPYVCARSISAIINSKNASTHQPNPNYSMELTNVSLSGPSSGTIFLRVTTNNRTINLNWKVIKENNEWQICFS